jgi:hypothetical protein
MLLDLSLRTIIDPTEYPSTLAVRLSTDNRPECGVFSGENRYFSPDEECRPMPRFTPDLGGGELGFYDYVIDRPVARATENQTLQYHYVAMGWDSGPYAQYPLVWLLVLQELSDGWDISVSRPESKGFTLILPDYQPGWIQRTGTKAL